MKDKKIAVLMGGPSADLYRKYLEARRFSFNNGCWKCLYCR